MKNPFDILTKRDTGAFADIETLDELRPAEAPVIESSVPALDRVRPERPPLVSQRLIIGAAVALGVLVVALVAAYFVAASARTSVPAVTGVSQQVAESRIKKARLVPKITERRFSAETAGQVLEQRPSAGTVLSAGDTVELVVSAGTEDFAMPDLIGEQLDSARVTLQGRGLVVQVEVQTSTEASGTVLGSVPAAGALVRSGDVVRLQVASQSSTGSSLQPYSLQGFAFVIDPAPVTSGSADAPLDVARRLRALLEASGASVRMLRSGTDTATADADRARRALESSSTAAIGLSVNASGPGGRGVIVGPGQAGVAATSTPNALLATAISSQVASAAAPATSTVTAADPVFAPLAVPWARVVLGSFADRADVASFNDPGWADRVARAIYAGIGEVYGVKEGQ